ncbi:hypothetical protein [Ruegeria hyattellae]|uniref:hypothetical protein n=1 Tax=Ruegeria hyattellae TaxID=3233337 RepID=UPI00355C7D4A
MPKLNSPVGAGKGAVNDPGDVKLVQKLLAAHAKAVGYKPPRTSGRIDQITITAIGHFQHEVVKTRVTSLVEPGSKTFKALSASPKKIEKQQMEAKGLPLKGKVYQVKWRGKTYNFTEEHMDHAMSAISKRLHVEVMRFIDTQSNYHSEYIEMRSGLVAAMVMMVTPDADIERPAKSLKKSHSEIMKLTSLAYSKNKKSLMAAFKQMTKTKIALNAVAFDLNILAKELGQSAKICEEIAVDLRDGAFDIVQLILVTNGVNPAAAGAGVAATKSTVQEIANGVILKGQWVKEGGILGSFKRVSFATVAGGFSGWLGGKVGKLIMNGVGTKLAGRMVNNRWFGRMLTKTAWRYGSKEIGRIVGRFPGITQKIGAEVVLETMIRMAHKFITGPAIVKALKKRMNLLEALITDAMSNAKSEAQVIDAVVVQMDKKGLAAEIAEEILNANARQIEAELEKALKRTSTEMA